MTLTVSIAPNEQSTVTSHVYNLPLAEEAEHLQGIDLYHFAVTDGTQIQLSIETPAGSKEAWYTVRSDSVKEHSSFFWLDVIKTNESMRSIDGRCRYYTANPGFERGR